MKIQINSFCVRAFAFIALMFISAAAHADKIECGGELQNPEQRIPMHLTVETTSNSNVQKITIYKADPTDPAKKLLGIGTVTGRLGEQVACALNLRLMDGTRVIGFIKRGSGAFMGVLAISGKTSNGADFIPYFVGCDALK